MFQALDDGAVLFSPGTELYFGLNHVGARVWELLATSADLGSLCGALGELYPDAQPEMLERDVRELLAQLEVEGLVAGREPAPGQGG